MDITVNITVNGKNTKIKDRLTILELLEHMKVKMPDMVSVELNGEIIRRDKYNEVKIKEGDKIEFLYFMGGGYGIQRGTN